MKSFLGLVLFPLLLHMVLIRLMIGLITMVLLVGVKLRLRIRGNVGLMIQILVGLMRMQMLVMIRFVAMGWLSLIGNSAIISRFRVRHVSHPPLASIPTESRSIVFKSRSVSF